MLEQIYHGAILGKAYQRLLRREHDADVFPIPAGIRLRNFFRRARQSDYFGIAAPAAVYSAFLSETEHLAQERL